MAVFAPVYRPSQGQQTLPTRQQKRERKRERGQGSPDESEDETAGRSPVPDSPRISTSTFRPVNRIDPYYVAGHDRQLPLPPSPFPHAAAKLPPGRTKSVQEELATFKPPIHSPLEAPEDHLTSLKRRHTDNVTAILHSCMLKGDWPRASRAWSLLLRTEIAGRGIDVRRSGRWGIGAELLMRRGTEPSHSRRQRSHDSDEDAQSPNELSDGRSLEEPAFSDEGFRLAREYYERLILQYPHTPRTQHDINALVFYPALFNVWIYEVQYLSKRSQRMQNQDRPTSSAGSENSDGVSDPLRSHISARAVRQRELEGAVQIAQRMDEVMLGPPYDASISLMRLRGMLGLWLSDLHSGPTDTDTGEDNSDLSGDGDGDAKQAAQNRQRAPEERTKALRLLNRVKAQGEDLPTSIMHLLEHEGDATSE